MPTTLPARRNASAPADFADFSLRMLLSLTAAMVFAATVSAAELPISPDADMVSGVTLSLP
jgi:hypothetical protein